MFIDLDRFKSINDTLGHQIGDKLLCEVAHRIEDSTDDGHRIGRLGGDEFAIVVREADDDKAVIALGERLIDRLSHTYEIDGHNPSTGASIALSLRPSARATPHHHTPRTNLS